MLKITTAILVAAGVIGGLATSASAADRAGYRLDRQAAAIEAGRKSGKITWTEGIKLRSEQRQIARLRGRFLADGRLSAAERRILNAKLRTARTNIRSEKRDSHKRWSSLPRVGR